MIIYVLHQKMDILIFGIYIIKKYLELLMLMNVGLLILFNGMINLQLLLIIIINHLK